MPKDIGHTALSPAQVVAVLLIVAALLTGPLAFVATFNVHDELHPHKNLLAAIATLSLLAALALFFLHHRNVSRPDVHPDILAQLIGPAIPFDVGGVHFWCTAAQSGATIHLLLLLQNVFDGPCPGAIELTPLGSGAQIPHAHRHADFHLQSAELIALHRSFPVPPDPPRELTYSLNGWIRAPRAPRIRFKRGKGLGRDSGALTVVALLFGVFYHSSAARLNVHLTPPAPGAAASPPPTDWQRLSLHTPGAPVHIPALRAALSALIS
jgi:hypothetical protein